MKHVIIGNGIAGITAAETLRKLQPDCEITMIGDETFPPYCRPMISLLLDGTIQKDQIAIRSQQFYEKLGITPILGNRVTEIDIDNKTVSIPDQGIIPFDKLLIATGADPRPVKAEGISLGHIFYMRTVSHVEQMLVSLPSSKRALVLGGGLVGFKAAYSLLKRGLKVTMLIRSGYPLSMQADEPTGKMVQKELESHGLEVRVGVMVKAFEGNGSVAGAHLSDGTYLPCDMVVIGKGVLPALDFVPQDRIEVDLGIRVNGRMETSVPDIYAAGDVAEYVDIARKSPWVNAIWPEAVAQGHIAGTNMAGRKVHYPGSLSRNVIRIYNLSILTGGIVNPPDNGPYDVVSHSDSRRNTYRKLVFSKDRLVGVVQVNAIEQGGVFLGLIQSQAPISQPKETLLEPDFSYGKVLI